ncbi:hypothetical protein E4T56_gene15118, partial [Termitomyces sp. T112]
IYAEDLEAWEKFAGIRIGAGDAVFIRTGRWEREAAKGTWDIGKEAAGLDASIIPWLRQRNIALLGSETAWSVVPFPATTTITNPVDSEISTALSEISSKGMADHGHRGDAIGDRIDKPRGKVSQAEGFEELRLPHAQYRARSRRAAAGQHQRPELRPAQQMPFGNGPGGRGKASKTGGVKNRGRQKQGSIKNKELRCAANRWPCRETGGIGWPWTSHAPSPAP